MAQNWRMPPTSRYGREIRPTFKVKQLIRTTVAGALRNLSSLLEDAEYKTRSAIRDSQPRDRVQELYAEWTKLQMEFEESESEYAKLVDGEELKMHNSMFKRKVDLQTRLVSDVETYLRAETVVKSGCPDRAQSLIEAEHQRLEREIRNIESRLSQVSADSDDSRPRAPLSQHPPPELFRSYITAPDLSEYGSDLGMPRAPRPPREDAYMPPFDRQEAPMERDPTTSAINRLAELLANQQRDRLPQMEPETFSGDLMEFPEWLGSFETLVEKRTSGAGERLFYLGKYTSGEARECISGLLRVKTEESFKRAKATLVMRYGNKFKVADAYRQKLFQWPMIKRGDGPGLLRFSNYLWQCNASLSSIGHLTALSAPEEMMKIVRILPGSIGDRWDRFVDRWCFVSAPDLSTGVVCEERDYPPFVELCKFLGQEARVANGPGKSDRLGSRESQSTTRPRESTDRSRHARVHHTGTAECDTEDSDDVESEVEEAIVHDSRAAATGNKPPITPKCFYCKEAHWLPDCATFMKMDCEKRREFVIELGLCFGCLKRSHNYRQCRSRDPDLWKDDPTRRTKTATTLKTTAQTDELEDVETGCCSYVLPVKLSHKANPGKEVVVYALMDTQSDSCFMTEEVSTALGVPAVDVELRLTTMGSSARVRSQKIVGLMMTGVDEKLPVQLPSCYTRQEIPANRAAIPRPESVARWAHLQQVASELPAYDENIPVGLLVGFNCPSAFIPRGCVQDGDGKPFAVSTALGWNVMGAMGERLPGEVIAHRTSVKEVNRVDFAAAFDLDFVSSPEGCLAESQDERLFRERVEESLHQTPAGNYEMDLPFREPPSNIPNNREMALKRLSHLRRKLMKNADFLAMYQTFMSDMLSSGYAEIAPEEYTEGQVMYTPHYGVESPKKPGTVRPVFDAKAQFKGVCLNSLLLPGAEDPNSLVGVICNFRNEKVGFMCDVKSMFYQVRVSKKHRDFLRFLWYRNGDPTADIVEYRMCVHVFGATSSPSCANTAFRRNADDQLMKYGAEVVNFIKRQFYVDDGLNSRSTVSEVVELFMKSHALCAEGGFHLCKFTCNQPEAIAAVPDELLAKNVKEWKLTGQNLPTEMSLGLIWHMLTDTFRFVVAQLSKMMTRRGLLSALSSIYDPLGLISPIILVGRLILQALCTNALSWDEPIPAAFEDRWREWYSELVNLEGLAIPRCIREKTTGKRVTVELHHFSDASTTGYGACTYIRLTDDQGQSDVNLLYSKSRVAPKKSTTMPRMELQAAVLAVKAAVFLQHELMYESLTHHFWCDSRVVLGYIKNSSRRFHLYVANRVATIRENSEPDQWRYVATHENPADLTSRGVTAAALQRSRLWWKGPAFISSMLQTPPSDDGEELADDPEVKVTRIVHAASTTEMEGLGSLVTRFSDWQRMLRVLLRCLKFGRLLRDRVRRGDRRSTRNSPQITMDPLSTVQQLMEVEHMVLHEMQQSTFPEESAMLAERRGLTDTRDQKRTTSRQLRRSSNLFRLDIFSDSDGLLRIGGRLGDADLPYEVRHPVLVPSRHHLATLLVRHYHVRSGHLGRQSTMAALRDAGYWVLSSRATVDRCTRACVICKKVKGRPETQKMADLPPDRSEDAPPFTYVGMDVFGPYLIKDGRSMRKRWVCAFTCLVIRAFHLEPLHSMTADSFMHAYRRMVNRRGPVRVLRSDRGTNFVGAAGELQAAFDDAERKKIGDELLASGCDLTEFRFNVPKASHMGGVWERPIRTMRSVLSTLLSTHAAQLTDEMFATFLAEAEGVGNSRPIAPMNEGDPLGEEPLCPSHLLTLKRSNITALPGKFLPEDMYSRKQWRRVQHVRQQFMLRWRREYLLSLQKRTKWEKPLPCLNLGDVVLLMDESLARQEWPMGVVDNVYPSRDGLTRKVGVRTATTHLDRPIHKLVLLFAIDRPADCSEDTATVGEK